MAEDIKDVDGNDYMKSITELKLGQHVTARYGNIFYEGKIIRTTFQGVSATDTQIQATVIGTNRKRKMVGKQKSSRSTTGSHQSGKECKQRKSDNLDVQTESYVKKKKKAGSRQSGKECKQRKSDNLDVQKKVSCSGGSDAKKQKKDLQVLEKGKQQALIHAAHRRAATLFVSNDCPTPTNCMHENSDRLNTVSNRHGEEGKNKHAINRSFEDDIADHGRGSKASSEAKSNDGRDCTYDESSGSTTAISRDSNGEAGINDGKDSAYEESHGLTTAFSSGSNGEARGNDGRDSNYEESNGSTTAFSSGSNGEAKHMDGRDRTYEQFSGSATAFNTYHPYWSKVNSPFSFPFPSFTPSQSVHRPSPQWPQTFPSAWVNPSGPSIASPSYLDLSYRDLHVPSIPNAMNISLSSNETLYGPKGQPLTSANLVRSSAEVLNEMEVDVDCESFNEIDSPLLSSELSLPQSTLTSISCHSTPISHKSNNRPSATVTRPTDLERNSQPMRSPSPENPSDTSVISPFPEHAPSNRNNIHVPEKSLPSMHVLSNELSLETNKSRCVNCVAKDLEIDRLKQLLRAENNQNPVVSARRSYQPKTRPEVRKAEYVIISPGSEVPAEFIPLAPGASVAVRPLWLQQVLATIGKSRERREKKAAKQHKSIREDRSCEIVKRLMDGFYEPEDLAKAGGTSSFSESPIYHSIELYATVTLKMSIPKFKIAWNTKMTASRSTVKRMEKN